MSFGSTQESARLRRESHSPRTTQPTHPYCSSCSPKGPLPIQRREPASRARSTRCTSTRCSPAVATGKTPAGLPGSIAAGRAIPLRPMIVLSLRGPRWPTTARQLRRRRPSRSSMRYRSQRFPSRGFPRVPITSSTGSTACVPAWRDSGRSPGLVGSTAPAGEPSWCHGCSCCCLQRLPCLSRS